MGSMTVHMLIILTAIPKAISNGNVEIAVSVWPEGMCRWFCSVPSDTAPCFQVFLLMAWFPRPIW